MKPPHGNRPGGPSRPPSDRGPYRGPGGQSSRSSGGPGQGHGGGPRGNGPGDFGHHGHQKPRPHGGPHGGGPHGGGPRDGASGGGASGGGFKPHRDDRGGRPFRPREPEGPRQAEAPKGAVWLYGHHAVAAALANPARRLRRLLLTEEAEAAIGKQLAPPWSMAPERVERARLDQLLGRDVVHQGAALLADVLAPPSLHAVLEKPGVIVVLDQVTDPRNVGAIMRSAAAFGAAAVITQDRNAPEETGALAKAASGALETLPLLRAVNIARTLIALKAANVWCIGLDAAGPPLSGPAFADRRVALVLGAEGEGLRRLTKETCDEVAGLTIKGAVQSLNVSAAASVALYELTRR
jgi:23S rRNA (guanosine2251-2'-O)-methyltransferase